MKKEQITNIQEITTEELLPRFKKRKSFWNAKTVAVSILSVVVLLVSVFALSLNKIRMADDMEGVDVTLALNPIAATTAKKDLISIPAGTVKANPFLPYRNIGAETITNIVDDVPKFDLIEPPEVIGDGSDAARVMDTIVSGILYDKHSPSAILNIEGNDYLVKTGDVVNNYKVLAIAQDSVTVKLGSNTYKAGIGEILTEGDLNHNDVANLNKKFGGERR